MLFCQLLFTNPKFYLLWILLVLFSIWVHESAHALTALRQGDDTAYRNGYLVPNPLKLMGDSGTNSIIVGRNNMG